MEATVAKIMLWGAVRFAMILYGASGCFALIILLLSDKHKRDWMGAMAMTFALIATAIVFFYYTNNKQKTRVELLKTLYYYPDRTPYHEYERGHDETDTEPNREVDIPDD